MFCPKCGNSLPDDASFCSECGNQIPKNPSVAPKSFASTPMQGGVSKPSFSGISNMKVQPLAIAAIVCAALALILSILPWFEVNSTTQGITGLTSGAADLGNSLFGGSSGGSQSNSFRADDSYPIWNMIALANTYDAYASGISQGFSLIGSSSNAAKAQSASALVTVLSWACVILWLVSVVSLIVGSVNALRGKGTALLRTGCIVMVVAAVVFFWFAGQLQSLGASNSLPFMCALVAAGGFVCTLVAKKA